MSDKSSVLPSRDGTAVLVFGMHRSGTSAFTRVINLLGVELGQNLIGGIEGNNRNGFWENFEAVEMNEKVLNDFGRSWHDLRDLPEDWLGTVTGGRARKEVRDFIRREYSEFETWGLKDPRLCLLAPLWIDAVQDEGFDVVPILVIRHPEEVAGSLRSRDGLTRSHVYMLWGMYVVDALRALAGKRFAVVDYAEFLRDWRGVLRRSVIPCGLELALDDEDASRRVDSFLSDSERHNRVVHGSLGAKSSALLRCVIALYEGLAGLTVVDSGLGAIEGLMNEFDAIAGTLRGPLQELFDHVQMHVQRAARLEGRLSLLTDRIEAAFAIEHELTTARTELVRLGDELARERQSASQELERERESANERLEHARQLANQALEHERQQANQVLEHELQVVSQELEHVRLSATEELERARQVAHQELEQERHAARLLQEQLGRERELVEALKGSASWRITAPLRFAKRIMMPSNWGAMLDRCFKSIYQRLPVPTHRRLALKGFVFRMMAPMIRNSRSFRAWRAYESQRGSVGMSGRGSGGGSQMLGGQTALLSSLGGTDSGAGNAAKILSELRAAAAGIASEHVPLDEWPVDISAIDVRAIAFYLPQFHPIPENDEWWGRGFTEWTNVSKAVPQFVGHYQPRLPGELGFYDLRLIDVMRRQVELARHYGLQGFCFHYYWFGGRRLLEKPLEQFLANKDIDFPFCICWANENWSRRWDGMDQDILIGQNHSPKDDIAFITALAPLLRDPRYIRVGGRPLIVLYRPSILPDAKATQLRWREYCREVGIGEIMLAMVQFDVEDPRIFGFDVAIEFPPHKIARGLDPINDKLELVNPEYSGYVVEYGDVIQRAKEHEAVGFPMIRGVFPSWDNEARKPGRGYTFANATPERYREWLNQAIAYARSHQVAGESLVFINAWNEWAEGAYLEPDRRYGYAYLRQTRDALRCRPVAHGARMRRVAIVSHDANPHGAQYLALNLAREMRNGLGMQVDVLLMQGGHLASAFAEVAQVHDISGMQEAELDTLLTGLRESGVELVIANTAVSGRITRAVASAGLHVVSLVHELTKLIRDYGLESAVSDLVTYSDKIVLPSEAVAEGLKGFVDPDLLANKSVLRPQGLFTRSKYRGATQLTEARANLRTKLGLEPDARIVLSVGYADRRKGVDLLLDAAAICCKTDPSLHFVWVGHADASLERQLEDTIEKGGLASRVHFVGMDFETDDYYAGADLYALPSREDPFPSVVLESLSVGTPVVAFAGTGGGADLVARSGGIVVPAFDVQRYADAIAALLGDDSERSRLGKIGIDVVDAEFSFRSYAMDLLNYGGMRVLRISVVVPNYNYARYLPERMASITAQTLPIYEIIFLDDGSTDNSVETIHRLRHEMNPEPRIIVNEVNSGSVFAQWQRGVQLARGDFVWIAEADDLAKPDFLERLVQGVIDHPDVVLAYCQSEAIDDRGELLMRDYLDYTAELSSERWAGPYVADGSCEVEIALGIKNTIPNVSAVLFKRQPLLEVLNTQFKQITRYKVAGDWAVYLHMLRAGRIFYSNSICNRHRRHVSSVTLGTAAELHYREVVELQESAREMFALSGRSLEAADAYRAWLREYLAIPDKGDSVA